MANKSKKAITWPDDTLPFRAEILEYADDISHMLEVCLSEGIIRQRYQVIEMLLPSIDDKARDIVEMAKVIRQSAPSGDRGRPPKWAEVTEEVIAVASSVVGYIREVKADIRRNSWGPVAAHFKVCIAAMDKIEDELESVEVGIVPLPFRQAFDEELPRGAWRRNK